MFAKPYKLKSNNTLKNSEKKSLAQRIREEFPTATEEKIKELVPVKASGSCMKLILHSGETVGVYVIDGLPVMIELDNGLVPTVCALWKIPDLIPTLTIHSTILSKIASGVPLYVPGVICGVGGEGVPQFASGALVAACTNDNTAAAMVARATISSADLLFRTSGVCVETIHVYRDLLCKEPKFIKIERPELGAVQFSSNVVDESLAAHIQQLNIKPPLKEEWPSLGKPIPNPEYVPVQNEPRLIPDIEVVKDTGRLASATKEVTDLNETLDADDSISEEPSIPSDMDSLLRWCLLTFIKMEGKRVELPLKTNLFYKNHLISLCPSNLTLDVKKSSYKKMSKFLDAMQQEGLIEVREVEKGVSALVALSCAHEQVRAHVVPASVRTAIAADAHTEPATEYVPPRVREMYCITAAVADLFPGLKRGTALTPAEVRTALTEYVKGRQLSPANSKGTITLDTLLAKITGKQENENLKWDEVMTSVHSKMTPSTEMQFADGSIRLSKTKLEPIRMQVACRSGNKKVTLVSNLDSFGFSLPELAHVCQVGVAASCGVTRTASAKSDQLMLQGDQTHFVAKLLIEKYGLPKKYVEGADKALKKKK